MSEVHDQIVRQLAENPHDIAGVHVLADALDENGLPGGTMARSSDARGHVPPGYLRGRDTRLPFETDKTSWNGLPRANHLVFPYIRSVRQSGPPAYLYVNTFPLETDATGIRDYVDYRVPVYSKKHLRQLTFDWGERLSKEANTVHQVLDPYLPDTHAEQMKRKDLPRKFAAPGEGQIFVQPGRRVGHQQFVHDVHDETGKKIGGISLHHDGGDTLHVTFAGMRGMGDDRFNALGPAHMRSGLRQLQAYYPNVKKINRVRIGGAVEKNTGEMRQSTLNLQRKGLPIRKAKVDGHEPAHPLVAGFPIEHALRHLANDPKNSDNVRNLSALALTGKNRITGEVKPEGMPEALWLLHDALHEHVNEDGTTGHPMKDVYNWMSAADKVLLDQKTRQALVEASNDAKVGVLHTHHDQWRYTPEYHAHLASFGLRKLPRAGRTFTENQGIQLLESLRRRVSELSPQTNKKDIDESIRRHTHRADMEWRRRNGVGLGHDESSSLVPINKAGAISPNGSHIQNENEKATRYRRLPSKVVKYTNKDPNVLSLGKSVADNPEDDTNKLALADALEETGDPRAELLRAYVYARGNTGRRKSDVGEAYAGEQRAGKVGEYRKAQNRISWLDTEEQKEIGDYLRRVASTETHYDPQELSKTVGSMLPDFHPLKQRMLTATEDAFDVWPHVEPFQEPSGNWVTQWGTGGEIFRTGPGHATWVDAAVQALHNVRRHGGIRFHLDKVPIDRDRMSWRLPPKKYHSVYDWSQGGMFGAWLSPQGEVHYLNNGEDHVDWLLRNHLTNGITKDRNVDLANAFRNGWHRISSVGKQITSENHYMPPTSRQRSALKDLAIEQKQSDVHYDDGKQERRLWSNPDIARMKRSLPPKKYSLAVRGDFIDSLRRIKSSNQAALHQTAQEVAQKLGLHPIKVLNALHDTPNGSVPGIAQAIYGQARPEQIHAAAAWIGLTGNLPGVAVFHPRPSGPDVLHRLRQEGSGLDIRQKMDRLGLTNRVLLPHKTGFDILIPDQGGSQSNAVAEYARIHKLAAPQASPGFFNTIGSQDQAKARELFRNKVVQSERMKRGK